MEVEAVNRVGSGEAAPAAALEGLLRAVVAETVAAAGEAIVQLLLAWGSWSGEIGMVPEKEDIGERFNIPVVGRKKNRATPEMKDDGETDEDDDEDEEDDDIDDQDDDGDEEEFSGDDGNENEGDADPEANEDGGSDDEDDEDDDEEDDDGDEDEEEDDEEDEEEEEQPPSKKRK